MHYRLTDRFLVQADLQKTWAFFSDANNLPKITPPAMKFRIDHSPPGGIEQDSLFDYTVHINGLPIKWKTLIIEWSPPRQFVDLQLSGPYALWHHRHTFEETEDGVACGDTVVYKLPFGPLGRIAQPLIVRRQLLEIFRFRRTAIERLLGPLKPLQSDVKIEPIR